MTERSSSVAKPDTSKMIFFNGKPGDIYYFAYASNMSREQISERCTNPKAIAIARLPNYKLAFFGYSKVWDSGMETVIEAPGHDAWGVIYELNSSDKESLDNLQDVRFDGSGAYFHYPAHLIDTKGVTRLVRFYKKDILGEEQMPSTEYLNLIVKGAEDNGLPSSYVEELRKIESKKASFEVPRRKKSGCESLIGGSCSECGDHS